MDSHLRVAEELESLEERLEFSCKEHNWKAVFLYSTVSQTKVRCGY